LFRINFEATSKKREIGGALALGGRSSINSYNNQMEVGIRVKDILRRKGSGGGTCGGGKVPPFLLSNGEVSHLERYQINVLLARLTKVRH
jgi:hypothetical protein